MNQLTTTNSNLPVKGDAWGSEGASRQDIIIPRLYLLQDISDAVKKGKNRPGQIINSSTGEVIGDETKPVEIIPISTFREWNILDVDDRGREIFREKVPMTVENENWPKEQIWEGKPIRRQRVISFFCLLPSAIEDFPVLVSFKGTSYFTGRQLSTHFQRSAMKGAPPAATTFKLGATERAWEKYTFKVWTLEISRPTTEIELKAARTWYELLNGGNVKVEDELEFNPEKM